MRVLAVAVSLLATRLALGGLPVDLADAGPIRAVPSITPDGGTLDREMVRQVVRAHAADLRDCYLEEVVRTRRADAGPTPTGTLTARWRIGADGAGRWGRRLWR